MHGLPPLPSLQHLQRLTDDIGLVQHARFDEPFYDEGYSIDDNARALILMCELVERPEAAPALEALAARYLTYIAEAWNPDRGRFRNFRSADGRWLEDCGSEDSHGRAVHALGRASNCAAWGGIAQRADELFIEALSSLESFTSPRAWAFALLGIEEYVHEGMSGRRGEGVTGSPSPSHPTTPSLPSLPSPCHALRQRLAQRLLRLYEVTATDDWPWFEDILTYCNAKLPHALLRAGHALERDDMIDTALRALRWLAEVHTADEGHFLPVGSNGFYRRDGERAAFDQQPIEAHAAVDASLDAYRLTSDDFWLDEAARAHGWFHGGNDLGLTLGDPATGACCDGLHPDRVNRNQGAESTLAYLLSSVAMLRAQAGLPRSELGNRSNPSR